MRGHEDIDSGEERVVTIRPLTVILNRLTPPKLVALTNELKAKLTQLKKESSGELVFPSPATQLPYVQRSKWLSKYCQIAGVKHFGIHAIRHLTASILTKNNVPLFDIKTILRHKSMQTTERYIHRLESLRAVLEIIPIKKAP